MNETTPQALTKREVTNIIRGELNFLKEVYKTNDLINRMEAIKLLGISPEALPHISAPGLLNTLQKTPPVQSFLAAANY